MREGLGVESKQAERPRPRGGRPRAKTGQRSKRQRSEAVGPVTITLELSAEQKERLQASAAGRGLSLQEYLQAMVDREILSPKRYGDAIAERLLALAAENQITQSPPDEALRREHPYEDRW